MLYLIEILHQTTTWATGEPHPKVLYLIEILHQTTTPGRPLLILLCCILSKFYIKPQQMTTSMKDGLVVSYRNSTSNHNSRYYKYFLFQLYLIEILHQTTTGKCIECRQKKLYLIEILHQTTTVTPAAVLGSSLYLIEILHQTTTVLSDISLEDMLYLIEILHQTTTSASAL